jgi:hypothetical protein
MSIDIAVGIILCLAVLAVCVAEYFSKSNKGDGND